MRVFLLLLFWGLAQGDPDSYCGVTFKFALSYGNSMVLQRAPTRARVWGYAFNTGDEIALTITEDASGNSESYTVAAVDGSAGLPIWEVDMDPKAAGGPYTITVSSADCELTLNEILFGDVWVCSGQSNMVHLMNNIDNPQPDIDNSVNYPNIRTFQVTRSYSDVALEDLPGVSREWVAPSPDNIGTYSAVCYLFGTHLFDKYQIPIGLVETDWGGTRVEAWSSPAALSVCFPDGPPGGEAQNGASALYNSMIAPLFPMPIFGAIWYQGEANTGNAQDYGCAIREMVNDWRASWFSRTDSMDNMFSFGEVQLAPNVDTDLKTGTTDVRWHQTFEFGYVPNEELEKFFMAVATDLPDFDSPHGSIHPRYKRQIARRLALGAFVIGYGDSSNGTFIGPLATNVEGSATDIVLSMGDGVELEQRGDPSTQDGYEVCCSIDATEVCDANSESWLAADILSVSTGTVVISQPCVSGQFAVGLRYTWRQSPCRVLEQCPIYAAASGNSLPAHPWKIDALIAEIP